MPKKRKYEHIPVNKLNLLCPHQHKEFLRRATDEEKAVHKAGFEALLGMLKNV